MTREPDASPDRKISGGGGLLELTTTEAISAMKAGDIKAETYVSSLLNRATSLDFLNAFISLDAEPVLNMARAADRLRAEQHPLGPLHGLPIALKDLVNTL